MGKRAVKQTVKMAIVPSGKSLVKHALATKLREQIVSGAIKPGARIVEGTWSRQFGVAQGSIREAINILAQEGLVSKASGRSARVVHLSEKDVLQLYELRGAFEGLAARLAAERRADTTLLQEAIETMRRAARTGNREQLLDADLEFHLELCRLSQNQYVLEHGRRILLPFFAFVRIRVMATGQGTMPWDRDLEAHQRVVDLLQEGEGDVVERYVHRVMERFAKTAYENWQSKAVEEKSYKSR